MKQDITNCVLSTCFEYVEKRICAIWYRTDSGKEEIGTGNLVKFKGKLYIISAGHVAEDADKAKDCKFVFHSGKILLKKDVSIVFFLNDESSDVGIFEIASPDEFESYFEYTNLDFNFCNSLKQSYILCGFPSEYAKVGANQRRFTPLRYATNFQSEELNFVYLDYPNTQPSAIITTHESGILPKAFGLSGGFIIEPSVFSSGKLWSPSTSKIFAIQSAYVDGKRLKCSRMEQIRIHFFKQQSNASFTRRA
jgi:hypothetical protein